MNEVLAQIERRIASLESYADPLQAGPLKYSTEWQRTASANRIAIAELRRVQGWMADVATMPTIGG